MIRTYPLADGRFLEQGKVPDWPEWRACVHGGPEHPPAAALPGGTLPLPAQDGTKLQEDAALHWTLLPPLPQPLRDRMRSQAAVGCSLVSTIIFLCVFGTHKSLADGNADAAVKQGFLVSVWAESAVAFACLLVVMFGDAGVIKRSEERCTPVPEGPLRDALLARRPLPLCGNIEDPKHGSYCVRCLVWRRRGEQAHHCSVCGRCVVGFDHHCGAYGRCIARGNMTYYRIIVCMGLLGAVTLLAAMVTAAKPEEDGSSLPGG